LSGFTDSFEGAALDPWWSTFTQSGSISLSTAQARTGKQSLQLDTTASSLDKGVGVYHSFASPQYGDVSVWFYDTGAGVSSSNYITISINNQATGWGAALDTYDYGFAGGGPGRGDQYNYFDTATMANPSETGITRTQAWHQFEFRATPQSLSILVDGTTVYNRAGDVPFDRVSLSLSGPYWRPAFTTFFDDFAFTPYQPDLVTNTNDSGPGSLRQAILNANANNSTPQTISFNIPKTDPGFANGVFTIQPLSQLPVLSQNITIDGTTQTAFTGNTNPYGPVVVLNGAKQASGDGLELDDNNTVKDLDINGFPGIGVIMSWAFSSDGVENNNQVLDNYVGTDPTGTIAVPNRNGIGIFGFASPTEQSANNLIQGNLVSGNLGNGIGIGDTKQTQILGNLIGTDRTGTANLGNGGNGIWLGNAGAPDNTIEGNTIAFNKWDGIVDAPGYDYSVAYTTSGHQGNAFLQNSIFSNGMLGIDLLAPGTNGNIQAPQGVPLQNTPGGPHQGANLLQNYPVLSSAVSSTSNTTVAGTLNSTPSTTFRLEFFANTAEDPTGYGEGQRYLGYVSVTTNIQGNADFQVTLPSVPVGQFLSATATDPGNNTSEFSRDLVVSPSAPPTLGPIADQTVAVGKTLTLTLQGSDPAGLPLTYSARVDSLVYLLKSTLGLYSNGNYYTNAYHGGEQWVQGTGGAWYYILPSGAFYKWSGAKGQLTGTLVAQLDPSYNANPSLLVNARPGQGQATVSLSGATLTITPNSGFAGQLFVTATASNGYNTASQAFRLTVVAPPTLAPIADQTIAEGKSLTLTLQGSDPAGLPLTDSAVVDSLAYHLKSTLGLYSNGNYYTNWGGGGEQWVQGTGGVWYYILPSGAFYKWSGSGLTGTFVAQLDPSDNANPGLLVNAQPGQGQATVSVSGATLTITPNAGFTGLLFVTATASDGYLSASRAFQVTVIAPPTLSPIADQSVAAGHSLTLTLQGSDPAGLPLTYSATADTLAYHLKSTLGLYSTGNYFTNWGGGGEQWVQGSVGAWYYILPSGGFYKWSGSGLTGTFVAQLDPSDNANPALLVNAQPGQGQAKVSVSGSLLTITPNAGFTGILYVTAIVSDGSLSASRTFKVTVTS
jgi:hypothetical protein